MRSSLVVVSLVVVVLALSVASADASRNGTDEAPQDCVVSEWGAWSTCSAGLFSSNTTQKRHRTVVTPPKNQGEACPLLVEERVCTNCKVSTWGAWGACSPEGLQERVRTITVQPSEGGEPCPDQLTESRGCQDCVLSAWSTWSDCEGGHKNRTREIITNATGVGKECPSASHLVETQSCTPNADCQLSEWGNWSACSSAGTRTRSRTIIVSSSGTGAPCGELEETDPCVPKTDCQVSSFGAWSTCEDGIQTRSRNITVAPEEGGKPCPADITETRECQDCEVSAWSTWSDCDKETHHKQRTREIITNATGVGKECPSELVEKVSCTPNGDCQMSEWGNWSACSTAGTRKRSRTIIAKPTGEGAPCGNLTETEECEQKIDCIVSAWSAWSTCSPNGVQNRTRTITRNATGEGTPCGPLFEEKECNSSITPSKPAGPEPSKVISPVIDDNQNDFQATTTVSQLPSEKQDTSGSCDCKLSSCPCQADEFQPPPKVADAKPSSVVVPLYEGNEEEPSEANAVQKEDEADAALTAEPTAEKDTQGEPEDDSIEAAKALGEKDEAAQNNGDEHLEDDMEEEEEEGIENEGLTESMIADIQKRLHALEQQMN